MLGGMRYTGVSHVASIVAKRSAVASSAVRKICTSGHRGFVEIGATRGNRAPFSFLHQGHDRIHRSGQCKAVDRITGQRTATVGFFR